MHATVGSLTIVDANQAQPKLFWNGEAIQHILSVTTFHNPPAAPKVTIRVINPSKVSPALTPTEQLRLTALYDAMQAAGVTVHKV